MRETQNGSRNEPLLPVTSPTQIQKVSLVKLAPLEKINAAKTSRKLCMVNDNKVKYSCSKIHGQMRVLLFW